MLWLHGSQRHEPEALPPKADPLLGAVATPSMKATRKYFFAVIGLMLLQIAMGVITAHYAVEGQSFFGLPLAQQPFEAGQFLQHIEVPGVWLERGLIRADDQRLMNSPLGLAGQRCMASLFFVAGSKLERNRRAQALEVARDVIEKHELRLSAGATSPDGQVVIVRVLAPVVEPAMHLLREVWVSWRQHFWGMPSTVPRIWST